jgi:Flp pilus assembly pilin Flp
MNASKLHESRPSLAPFHRDTVYIQNGERANKRPARNDPDGNEMSEYPLEGHNMLNFIKNFHNDEDGAVTVDWVVLTAAIVGLGIAVLTSVSGGTTALSDKISSELGTMTVATY